MRPIPPKLREEMASDPYYKFCARRHEGTCSGRITWEHALIYAGKQINEKWAIIPLCVYHHLGEGLNKELNVYIALERATPEEFAKYPRKDWSQIFRYLSAKYGNYGRRTTRKKQEVE